jgi:hypothetical protein
MYGSAGSDALRQLLLKPNVPMSDIISSDFLIGLWTNGDSQLVDYMIGHFDDFINLAFQIVGPASRLIIERCSRLLASACPEVRDRLVAETNIVQFILDYIPKITEYSALSQRVYFALLPNVVFDRMGTLYPEFESEAYFLNLFSLLYLLPACAFLDDLIGSSSRSVRAMLQRINLSAVLLDQMLLDNPTIRDRSQALFIQALNSDVAFGLPDSLIEKGRLFQLVAIINTLKDPDGFDFLRLISAYGSQKTAKQWKGVEDLMGSLLPAFCEAAAAADSYDRASDARIRLIVELFKFDVPFGDELRVLLVKLSALFFQYPRNSFLHNSFVSLLRLIEEKHALTPELLREMKLCTQIVDCYQMRGEIVTYGFWGQLREIATLVEPHVAKTGVDMDVWRGLVVSQNKGREDLIERGFAGSLGMIGRKKSRYRLYFSLVLLVVVLIVLALLHRFL